MHTPSISRRLALFIATLVAGAIAYVLIGTQLVFFLPVVTAAYYARGRAVFAMFVAFAAGLCISVAFAVIESDAPREQAVSWALFFMVALFAGLLLQRKGSGFTVPDVLRLAKNGGNDRAGTTITEFLNQVHPEDRDATRQAADRAFWSGFPQVMQHRRIQPDGSYAWTEYRAEPVYGVARDAPAKVSAQHLPWTIPDALGETAEAARMAMVLETLFGTGWSMDTVGRFTYTTPNAQTTIGQTLSQMNEPLTEAGFLEGGDLGWKRIFHPDEYERVAASLRHALRTGDPWNNEYRLKRATTGEYGWYRVAMRPTRNRHGTITGWYGLSIDITVYKETDAALRVRERELSQLVDLVPVHIMRLTGTGKPVFFSRNMLDFFALDDQYSEKLQVTLATMRDAVHADDRHRLDAVLRHALRSGERFAVRYRVRRADGIYRWMDSRAEPIRDENGTIAQWYAVSLDIDDQVRAQDQLRLALQNLARASQAASLAELSASIAHEVTQPLAALLSSTDACQRWLAMDPPNIDRAQQALDRIVSNGHAATDIVRRIRALFARSTEAREPTRIGRVVEEACGLMAEELSRQGVKLVTEIADGLPALVLDRIQIQQVLINLLRNGAEAMEATTDMRLLRVAVGQVADVIQVAVSDTGPGLENPAEIFEPFFTTKRSGMGMGLAICRSIVEFHGGEMRAENNKPRGALFVFTLPIDKDHG